MENIKKQWHPAFVAAMVLELKENRESLLFEKEYNLNTKPLEIDLLVIKKNTSALLQNEMGELFRGHNIMEFKSPKDHLDIDTIYMVWAYACLYKAYGKAVDAIKAEDMRRLFRKTSRLEGKLDKELADSVLEVSVKANKQLVEKLRGYDDMSQALLEIMKPVLMEREKQVETRAKKEGIKGLVNVLRALGHGENEIKEAIMKQYYLSEEEMSEYL